MSDTFSEEYTSPVATMGPSAVSDTKRLWEGALTEIELAVSKANFTTWFKDTAISRVEEGVVYLSVPNTFVKDWLLNKYHKFTCYIYFYIKLNCIKFVIQF
mgnify:CR=1 FL=1